MIIKVNITNGLWIIMGIIWITSAVECHEFNSKTSTVEIIPGLKLLLQDNEINVKFNVKELFSGSAIQSRHDDEEKPPRKPNVLKRFGAMLMMVPLAMQMLSLPGALASIKMSLLKSFFVGKLALIIMLYNLLRSLRVNRDMVVVHQQPAQHYNHYYAPLPDDEDKGWFG